MRTALLLALLCQASQPAWANAANPPAIVFENATVIDGTGREPAPSRTVVVEGDRIVALYETGSRERPAGARVIDLAGHTIMPGLIDAHVHLWPAEDRENRLRALLHSGVTTVRELAGDARITAPLQQRQAHGDITSPAIRFAAVFYGPRFLEDTRSRSSAEGLEAGTAAWSRVVTPELDIARAMVEARATGATGVKLYASLTAEQLAELSREARRHDLLVWTHSVLFPTGSVEALAAGVDSLIHAKGLVTVAGLDGIPDNFAAGTRQWMLSRPFARVDPEGPAFRAFYAEMVRQGTILEPALMADGDLSARPLPPPRAAMRDWACRATGAAFRAGVAIGAGTDTALRPGILQRELVRLVECGLPALQAVRAATQVNARALGIEATHGTVEAGMVADLTIVAGNPAERIADVANVRYVVQSGRLFEVPAPARD